MIGKSLGKYNFEQCLLVHCLCENIITFFCASFKNHYLGFLGVSFFSIQELQYEDNMLIKAILQS